MTPKEATNALSKRTFAGYGGDAEFLRMEWLQFKNWCKGQFLIAIGEGQFDAGVSMILQYGLAREKYQSALHKLVEKS